MSLTVALTLDDETVSYLARIAADQGRTPAEVAAWMVTEDLRRERAIDAELLACQDDISCPGGSMAWGTSYPSCVQGTRALCTPRRT